MGPLPGPIQPVGGQGKFFEELKGNELFQSAICGKSDTASTGVLGLSTGGDGVTGQGATGVRGTGTAIGVRGASTAGGEGVLGEGRNGVHGRSASPSDSGVWGENTAAGYGVSGSTTGRNDQGAGVWGNNGGSGQGVRATSTAGAGLWASGKPAGQFEGDINVNGKAVVGGDIMAYGNVTVAQDIILSNADCAEDFHVSAEVNPGMVVVIDSSGALKPCEAGYDRCVAGVISGAGEYRPGIILGRQEPQADKLPIALSGRVHCKVDAGYAPVNVGDLLTTSPTPGHAMVARDATRAFGAVIGKALQPLAAGQGLVAILVALQ